MNMPRPSMLWIYGLIGAFIIGWYVFGDVNDTPLPSDWATVQEMVETRVMNRLFLMAVSQRGRLNSSR